MMSRRRPLATLAALATLAMVATVAAQQASTSRPVRPASSPSRPSEDAASLLPWIDRVQGSDPRGQAFAKLLQIGAPAAEPVAAAVDPKKPGRLPQLLLLLAEMGPVATGALDTLWARAEAAEGETRRQILDCILSVAPHLDAGSRGHIGKVQGRLLPWMLDETLELGQRQRYAETWYRAVQLSMIESHGPDQLIRAAARSPGNQFRPEMAMILLSYSGELSAEQSSEVVRLSTARLAEPVHRPEVTTHSGGKQIRYTCGPSDHRRWAAALLRMKPKPEGMLAAHRYLLEHGLVHERWRALNALRQQPRLTSEDETALRQLAADEKLERPLRYEAVTTLGLLQDQSGETRELLRRLAGSKDRALAARAKAALR